MGTDKQIIRLDKEEYTVKQLIPVLNLGKYVIQRLFKQGKIKGRRDHVYSGSPYLATREQVQEYLDSLLKRG